MLDHPEIFIVKNGLVCHPERSEGSAVAFVFFSCLSFPQ
jgi:hypothetical protein